RSKGVYRRKYPEVSSIHTVPFCDDQDSDAESCSCGFFADGESQLETMMGSDGYVDPDEVSYLILEPIQGEGGYRFPNEAFMDEIARVSETYDLTLIADEIQAGV